MTKQKPIEIITPPNMLKAKIGGALPVLDQDAITRAEEALADLGAQFDHWIKDEFGRLNEAWTSYESSGGTDEQRDELHRRAHDLKGLAPTYGYPLVGRVANSLCKLTTDEIQINAPMSLLRAHIDTVRVMVGQNIRSADHPVGRTLAAELEEKMVKLVAAAAPSPQAKAS